MRFLPQSYDDFVTISKAIEAATQLLAPVECSAEFE